MLPSILDFSLYFEAATDRQLGLISPILLKAKSVVELIELPISIFIVVLFNGLGNCLNGSAPVELKSLSWDSAFLSHTNKEQLIADPLH